MMKNTVLSVLALTAAAHATPPFLARSTFQLERVGAGGLPMEVAHHPQFGYYYAASRDGDQTWVWTYDDFGNLLSGPTATSVDIRSMSYNSNTLQIEVILAGDSELHIGELDADGIWVDAQLGAGVVVQKPHPESMPVYVADCDCFFAYGESGKGSLSQISRASGLIIGEVELDLATAGIPPTNLASFVCGYLEQESWLVVFDSVNEDVVVFDTAGNYCGTSHFPRIDIPDSHASGSANGQLYTFDASRNQWGGYTLSAECPDPNECGDWDGDGDSDADDFFAYLDAFARRDPCADITLCGTIDGDDFFAFLDNFVNPCP